LSITAFIQVPYNFRLHASGYAKCCTRRRYSELRPTFLEFVGFKLRGHALCTREYAWRYYGKLTGCGCVIASGRRPYTSNNIAAAAAADMTMMRTNLTLLLLTLSIFYSSTWVFARRRGQYSSSYAA